MITIPELMAQTLNVFRAEREVSLSGPQMPLPR
jgi:hypothetical protein